MAGRAVCRRAAGTTGGLGVPRFGCPGAIGQPEGAGGHPARAPRMPGEDGHSARLCPVLPRGARLAEHPPAGPVPSPSSHSWLNSPKCPWRAEVPRGPVTAGGGDTGAPWAPVPGGRAGRDGAGCQLRAARPQQVPLATAGAAPPRGPMCQALHAPAHVCAHEHAHTSAGTGTHTAGSLRARTWARGRACARARCRH